MTVRYTPSFTGTNSLMNSAGVQQVLRAAAEKGTAYAVSISPVRTGEYKSSFRISTKAHGGVHGDRAQATIVNTSPHAARVEWADGYHVLAETADYIRRTGI